MLILVTGATGKVGRALLDGLASDPRFADARFRAMCHNRMLPPSERLDVVRGSISDASFVDAALEGVTHVVHMATVKETRDSFIDVSIRGMFNLLEGFRASPAAEQFILIGGDCSVGHMFVPYDGPVTDASPRRAYPGVYALSKVVEEVMLEQYGIQYGVNWTTLRAPWIMEKDDFRFVLSFGPDQFGGPDWDSLIDPGERREHAARNRVPLMLDASGNALRRNFVHVDDLVAAISVAIGHPAAAQRLFNVAMTEAVDYGAVASRLRQTRGMEPVTISTPFHSNLLDNAGARLALGWAPRVDTADLVDRAFAYERAPDDPRKVWYSG